MNAPSDGEGDVEVVKALLKAQDMCTRTAAARAVAEAWAERAGQRAAELEDSIAFRLGSLLLDAVRSPRKAVGLPRALASLMRYWRARARAGNALAAGAAIDVEPQTPMQLPGADIARAWHLRNRPAPPAILAELRVAAIVDPFTDAGFSPECHWLNLRVEGAEDQLDEFQPHVLFVESAWRGRDGGWLNKISPCSGELVRLVDACRRRAIPTVFWCKEDPTHFENFITAAALFDHVFTTDSECLGRYRAMLGHDRVDVLGFACQPAIHNPVEVGPRKVVASFAGSWYVKYPERARDFEDLVQSVQPVLEVEIYDRNHERADPAFEYPDRYRPLIRSGVPYSRISEVYKACEFALTVNTITSSPTMFARRVHELLACNTITISNHSIGIDRTYGDRVLMAGRDDLAERLTHLRDSQDARHRLRLRGLREVMTRHTAASRLARIAAVAVGPIALAEPAVWVIARADSDAEADHLIRLFRAQQHVRKHMLLVRPAVANDMSSSDMLSGITIVPVVDTGKAFAELLPDDAWVAPWHAGDYYGPCYLLDLMLVTPYAEAAAVGKASHFAMGDGAPRLESVARPYTRDQGLWLRSSILRPALLGNASLKEVLDQLDGLDGTRRALTGLAVDEYGYCRHGAGHAAASQVDVG